MSLKKFIKMLESGKYKVPNTNFIISKGFTKIIDILFPSYRASGRYAYEYLWELFKDTDMSNVDCRFSSKFGVNWRFEIPFILPKYDSNLAEPTALPDYIKTYGVKKFIEVIKAI